ncbi:DNA-3-methyladenine glycosylase I [Actinoplanes sp. CA-054009]
MTDDTGLVIGLDGRARCFWGGSSPDYAAYHDDEWGRPVRGDDALYERLCLEAFQSGLSWITILRKRPAFRAAFAGFEIEKVAAFSDADAARLMTDTGIVRNRMKIEAAIANARAAADLPIGLTELLWSFAPDPRPARPETRADVPAITPASTAMAKDLKKRGFRFVGPTTAYALMQATGMVDDHVAGCWVPPVSPHPRA